MGLSLRKAFPTLEGPRVERHKPLDILTLPICVVISGAEGWEAIEQLGKQNRGKVERDYSDTDVT